MPGRPQYGYNWGWPGIFLWPGPGFGCPSARRQAAKPKGMKTPQRGKTTQKSTPGSFSPIPHPPADEIPLPENTGPVQAVSRFNRPPSPEEEAEQLSQRALAAGGETALAEQQYIAQDVWGQHSGYFLTGVKHDQNLRLVEAQDLSQQPDEHLLRQRRVLALDLASMEETGREAWMIRTGIGMQQFYQDFLREEGHEDYVARLRQTPMSYQEFMTNLAAAVEDVARTGKLAATPSPEKQ